MESSCSIRMNMSHEYIYIYIYIYIYMCVCVGDTVGVWAVWEVKKKHNRGHECILKIKKSG
jgi:hypothetical protein